VEFPLYISYNFDVDRWMEPGIPLYRTILYF
jgi:hypothetical protein